MNDVRVCSADGFITLNSEAELPTDCRRLIRGIAAEGFEVPEVLVGEDAADVISFAISAESCPREYNLRLAYACGLSAPATMDLMPDHWERFNFTGWSLKETLTEGEIWEEATSLYARGATRQDMRQVILPACTHFYRRGWGRSIPALLDGFRVLLGPKTEHGHLYVFFDFIDAVSGIEPMARREVVENANAHRGLVDEGFTPLGLRLKAFNAVGAYLAQGGDPERLVNEDSV